MRTSRWRRDLTVALAVLAIAAYAVRWYAFPGETLHNEMLRFFVGDIAFLFVQVLIVTIVLDGLMERRRNDELRQHLNMVIGAFFSHTGRRLLATLAPMDAALGNVADALVPRPDWTADDYRRAQEHFLAHRPDLTLAPELLAGLRTSLRAQYDFLLTLLSNQSLLEHGDFTDLLWALTHLSEELEARDSFDGLPDTDVAHLAGDVERAYRALGREWLAYLAHLQRSYPYLFSLAVRTNPFDPEASPVIR